MPTAERPPPEGTVRGIFARNPVLMRLSDALRPTIHPHDFTKTHKKLPTGPVPVPP